ncbi:MAG: hypothetical protein H0W64_09745 [Gammaproteobacteria bacterium]|nr:hypothetical protein [Gammaproteobacteria bacterium]
MANPIHTGRQGVASVQFTKPLGFCEHKIDFLKKRESYKETNTPENNNAGVPEAPYFSFEVEDGALTTFETNYSAEQLSALVSSFPYEVAMPLRRKLITAGFEMPVLWEMPDDPTWVKATKAQLAFDRKQKEMFCRLAIDHTQPGGEQALLLQKSFAAELARLHYDGSEDLAKDLWKSNEYRLQAGLPPIDAGDDLFRTKKYYELASKYTEIRINWYIVQETFAPFRPTFDKVGFNSNSVLNALGIAFIHRIAGYAGLSYGLDFLFDCGVILYSTFFKEKNEREKRANLPYLKLIAERFKNVVHKEGRLPRMANALLWFSINFSAFVVTGGLSIIFNLIGFGIDCLSIAGYGIADVKAQNVTLQKLKSTVQLQEVEIQDLVKKENVNEKIMELRQLDKKIIELTSFLKEIEKGYFHSHPEANKEKEKTENELVVLRDQRNALNDSINKSKDLIQTKETEQAGLKLSISKQEAQIKSNKQKYTGAFVYTTLTYTSIALTFFPPTMAIGFILLATMLAIGATWMVSQFAYNYYKMHKAHRADMMQANPSLSAAPDKTTIALDSTLQPDLSSNPFRIAQVGPQTLVKPIEPQPEIQSQDSNNNRLMNMAPSPKISFPPHHDRTRNASKFTTFYNALGPTIFGNPYHGGRANNLTKQITMKRHPNVNHLNSPKQNIHHHRVDHQHQDADHDIELSKESTHVFSK